MLLIIPDLPQICKQFFRRREPERRDMHVAPPARRGRRFQKLFSERWTGAARFAYGKTLCFKRAAAGGRAICRFSVCIGRRSANLCRTGRTLRIARQSIAAPRRAGQLHVRVRLRDGVSQCRLYIIMYSWAAGSEAPWKTIPRHACHSPAPPEARC